MSDDAPQTAQTFLGPGAGGAPVGDLPPGFVIGEYHLDKVLGRGGMGTVYAGLQPVIEKRVAIKVSFGFGQTAVGRQYFARQYLEGTTLPERIDKGDLSGDEMPIFLAQ